MKISIKGPIIPSNHQSIYDWLGMEATSPKKVSGQLEKANKEDLEVEINSGGGSVFDASEIYTALKDYSGNVTVKIVGLAASAASVIAMAGKKVMMSPTAQMMIHNASARNQGDYRNMDHMSGILKNTNQTIANAYSIKSGKSYEELLSMMDDETWLTAQQALEHSLIDEVMFEGEAEFVASTTDGGLLPKEVIDKIRNEMNEHQFKVPSNQVTQINDKGEKEVMNLEQLKNDYPELYKQIKNEGYEEGVNAENIRIKEIEDVAMPGYENLVNAAKFDSKDSAEKLTMSIVKAQKEQMSKRTADVNADAAALNNVPGSVAPEQNPTPDNVNEASFLSAFKETVQGGKFA